MLLGFPVPVANNEHWKEISGHSNENLFWEIVCKFFLFSYLSVCLFIEILYLLAYTKYFAYEHKYNFTFRAEIFLLSIDTIPLKISAN